MTVSLSSSALLSSSSSRAPFVPMAAQAPRDAGQAVSLAAKADGAEAASDSDEIRKVAESFEAIILRQLLASMRKAKLSEDVFGSSATDNFREMADARTADAMSNMRQFGIADMVEKQLRGYGVGVGSSNSAVTDGNTKDNKIERIAG
jgi:peptidoglycan hydrolase FlgJ